MRRFVPLDRSELALVESAKGSRRPGTQYGVNSLNGQMPVGVAPSAEEEFLDSLEIDQERVVSLARGLGQQDREYVEMYATGATTREMAQRRGTSQSTASRRLRRAKRALWRAAQEATE